MSLRPRDAATAPPAVPRPPTNARLDDVLRIGISRMEISAIRPKLRNRLEMSWTQIEDRVKILMLKKMSTSPHYYLPHADNPPDVISEALITARSERNRNDEGAAARASLTYMLSNGQTVDFRYSKYLTRHNSVEAYLEGFSPPRMRLQYAMTADDVLRALDDMWTDTAYQIKEKITRLKNDDERDRGTLIHELDARPQAG